MSCKERMIWRLTFTCARLSRLTFTCARLSQVLPCLGLFLGAHSNGCLPNIGHHGKGHTHHISICARKMRKNALRWIVRLMRVACSHAHGGQFATNFVVESTADITATFSETHAVL
jgi:hypothetical protein